jgi:hypothetical protein
MTLNSQVARLRRLLDQGIVPSEKDLEAMERKRHNGDGADIEMEE